jgi:VWFA-related protein
MDLHMRRNHRLALRSCAVALALVSVTLLGGASQEQPPRTFRSSVDLVPVDVNVVDSTGRPVADLTAEDFALTVDGKPRRIVSAQFITVARNTDAPEPPTTYSSNAAAPGGRLILLVIDQGNIGSGRGKYAVEAASRFIAGLSKADRIGLATIPGAGPQIDFTANHALVQTLLQKVVGAQMQDERQARVGISEALAFSRGNEQVMAEVIDRECPGLRTPEEIATCRRELANDARTVFLSARSRTMDSLVALRRVAERLAGTKTPKTLVLLSEGLLIERDLADISWVGPVASRGQVTLYVLQLDPPQFEASTTRVSPSRSADIELGQDGLGLLAGLARGTVFRVVSNANSAFTRLALELSGYYLLSFEPQAGDRDGKTHKIRIDVPSRRRLEVRSRREFEVDAPRTHTTEEMLAETLRSPLLAGDIGLKAVTYTLTDAQPQKLRIMVAAEIDRSQVADGAVALAYVLIDSKGGGVASQIEPEVKTPIAATGKTQTYFGAIAVDPGVYTLKLAVVEPGGKRGSVEHTFRAQLTPAGQIRMSDLMIADDTGAAGLKPAVSGDFAGDFLHGYVELHSDAVDQLKSATVLMDVASTEQGRALDEAVGTFQDRAGAPETRRTAEAAVPIALLPPGDYLARAVVTIAGRKAGQVTRPFRIVRAAGAKTVTETAPVLSRAPAIAFTSRMDAFERTSVLAPQVVGFFLDRMNIGNRVAVPPAAMEAARAGRFDAAIGALRPGRPDELAPVFLAGLELYAKGELEQAAGKFRDSLRIDSEFFPAAFYLGACYAAGGRDREAVGAWQTSLVTESNAPFIYTLLGDALLRLRDNVQALDILVEASGLWPDNEEVRVRLGTAQAAAGRFPEAVRTLDSYLTAHPEDHERLLIAMRAIYETRSAGKTIASADDDRQRFNRYAAAYAIAGGPQQALVSQWKRFVDR